jgi:hypothetical protein
VPGDTWEIPHEPDCKPGEGCRPPRWKALYILFEPQGHVASLEALVKLLYEGTSGYKRYKEEVRFYSENAAKASWKYYTSLWVGELIPINAAIDALAGNTEVLFEKRVKDSFRNVVRAYMDNMLNTSFYGMLGAADQAFVEISENLKVGTEGTKTEIGAVAQRWYKPFFRRYAVFVFNLRFTSGVFKMVNGSIANHMANIAEKLKAEGTLSWVPGRGWMRPALVGGANVIRGLSKFLHAVVEVPSEITSTVLSSPFKAVWAGARAGIAKISPTSRMGKTWGASWAPQVNAVKVFVSKWRAVAGPGAPENVSPGAVRAVWEQVFGQGSWAATGAAVKTGVASAATVGKSSGPIVGAALASLAFGALVMWEILEAVDRATAADVGDLNPQGALVEDAAPIADKAQAVADTLIPHVRELVAIREAIDRGVTIPEDPILWPYNMRDRIATARAAAESLPSDGVSGIVRGSVLAGLAGQRARLPDRIQGASSIDPEMQEYAEMFTDDRVLREILEPRLETYFGQMGETEIEEMPDSEFEAILLQIVAEADADNDPVFRQVAADAMAAFVYSLAAPEEPDEELPIVLEAEGMLAVIMSELSKTLPDLGVFDDALTNFEYIIPELPYELTGQAREILIAAAGARVMIAQLLDQSESQTVFGDTSPGGLYIPAPTPEQIQQWAEEGGG